MIEPTIGRKVWFRPNGREVPALSCYGDQPMDATVIFVHGPRMVNLAVIDHNGLFFSLTSVPLQQDDEPVPEHGTAYAEWMPFQKGQAAKVEARVAECGESLSMIPRMEPFQMAQSLAWAAKDLLATPCIGSELKAKADGAAMRALERMEGLLGIDGLPEVDLEDEPLEVVIVGGPTVTAQQIEDLIVSAQYHVLPGTTVTICCLSLRNGFNVIGESACASPENFDEAKGRKYARENAVSKIWRLEGYRLKQRLHENAERIADGRLCDCECDDGCDGDCNTCSCSCGGTRRIVDMGRIARLAHEVNRAYCLSLGDDSQPAWEDAPAWQRESAIAGVHAHMHSDLTPEQSHESWMAQKAADGWKYGPIKDAELKEHPCFLPYAELPAEQKTKDYLFRAAVKASL